MAHFAEINSDGVVLRVLVVSDEYLLDEDGNEQEALGQARLIADHGGEWLQCSYNARIRGCYPGKGYTYDRDRDVFLAPPVVEDIQPADGNGVPAGGDTPA